MALLSVNVNKLATLRNSRGKNNPDLIKTTLQIVECGVRGITIHPRPDQRHIRRQDVYDLAQALPRDRVEFNIEGYPSEDFLDLIDEVEPDQCTLVPDPPEALTSNAGWKVHENRELLGQVSSRLQRSGVRASLFVDPKTIQDQELKLLCDIGVARIELYTEAYAEDFATDRSAKTLQSYVRLAESAHRAGLGVNAGHDLNLDNLASFVLAIPALKEVSIGHALICDALMMGLEKTIAAYLKAATGVSGPALS